MNNKKVRKSLSNHDKKHKLYIFFDGILINLIIACRKVWVLSLFCGLPLLLYAQNNNNEKAIDPFKVFSPDFNQSIEKNDIYQEWEIRGVFPGIFQKKIYKTAIQDTVYYVCPGYKNQDGVNSKLHVRKLVFLPDRSKQITVHLQYEYCPYKASELFFEIKFNKCTSLLQQKRFTLPATFQIDNKLGYDSLITVHEFNLNIPTQADNAILCIKSEESAGLSQLALSRCEIEIDGNPLESYTYDQTLSLLEEEILQIKKQISDTLMIPDNIRLIGIGESVHGCLGFAQKQSEIIKNLILHNHIQFFGFEISFLQAYHINEYIHGKKDNIEEILLKAGGSFNNSENINLFQFMRAYNEEYNYPLTVMGFDIDIVTSQDEFLFQVENLFSHNLQISQCIDLLSNYLKKQNDRYRGLSQTQINHLQKVVKETYKQMDKASLYEAYFLFTLSDYINRFNYNLLEKIEYKRKRDSIMAENTMAFFDCLPENSRMFIAGHLGHLSQKQQYDGKYGRSTSPMGYYLSKRYERQYFVLGLFTGSGTFFSHHYKGYASNPVEKHYPLAVPIGNSLEQLGMAMNIPTFYLNNPKEIAPLEKIRCFRSCGNQYCPFQFQPGNIQEEVDAVWFLRESQS
jgi:erythromycin esterase-like protein